MKSKTRKRNQLTIEELIRKQVTPAMEKQHRMAFLQHGVPSSLWAPTWAYEQILDSLEPGASPSDVDRFVSSVLGYPVRIRVYGPST